MSNRYNGRYPNSVFRGNEPISSTKTSDWFNDFAKNLEKNSVEPVRQQSLYEQINNIINKSKYSSVEEKVKELQQRTGLYNILNNIKSASAQIEEPAIFSTIPEMKVFIDNFVNDRPGTSIPAVCEALLNLDGIRAKMNANDLSEDVKKYINDKIIENRSVKGLDKDDINFNIGKVDYSDNGNEKDDPLSGLEPHKNK